MMAEEFLCYDPRDPEQEEGHPSTWKPTSNPALIMAEAVRYQQEWREAMTTDARTIFWRKVAEQADYCDQPVTVQPDIWAEHRRIGVIAYVLVAIGVITALLVHGLGNG